MIVEVLSYDKEKHELQCKFPNGSIEIVDPFVGCAVEHEDGNLCVGKFFEMTDYWRRGPYLCHGFEEVIPAREHTGGE